MQFSETGPRGSRRLFLNLEPGEHVVASIKAFAADMNLDGASFTGIGAVRDLTLAWFDVSAMEYVKGSFEGTLELLALTGNVGSGPAGEVVAHAHALCSGKDLKAVGGHLVEAMTAVTVEIALQETGFPLRRAHDPAFGLNLLNLQDQGNSRK